MRVIKFRAWDKENKIMYYEGNFAFEEKGFAGGWTGQPTEPSWSYRKPEEIELMQFTGLHDKDGKEIYEGDIIETWYFENNEDTLGSCRDLNAKAVIKYYTDRASFVAEPTNKAYSKLCNFSEFSKDHLKVIGNIYENPELVK
jgi:uncharacterized phage protein (TIGR01671 family)